MSGTASPSTACGKRERHHSHGARAPRSRPKSTSTADQYCNVYFCHWNETSYVRTNCSGRAAGSRRAIVLARSSEMQRPRYCNSFIKCCTACSTAVWNFTQGREQVRLTGGGGRPRRKWG
eukprot:gene11433-biopygen19887